jgi:dihydrofolate reductase
MEIVVAVSENDVIGRRNQLPWRLPADLKRFKALTMGHPILMGRNTYQSIGKALPGRTNIVLSRSTDFAPADCTVVPTLDAARREAGGDAGLMVIGGGQIYRECIALVSKIHLTLVHTRIEDGDAFFDAWRGAEWRETYREPHPADEKNSSAYTFVTLERSVTPGRSAIGGSSASISRSARA